MKLFMAAVVAGRDLEVAALKAGAKNFMASYGITVHRPGVLRFASNTIVCVSDELGQAFLATGLPHTCEAFAKWFQELK